MRRRGTHRASWPTAIAAAGPLAAALIVSCGSSTEPSGPGPDGPGPGAQDEIVLTEVVSGLGTLTALTAPPGDSRLFVVEQSGRIWIVRDGTLVATPFLDIRSLTSTDGERGLLGLAFHPAYATNGRFFVNYTNTGGDTRVVEYGVGTDPDLADPASAAELLAFEQPFSNHNGGDLAFGPDGTLYVATGDGGSANDPQGNGQSVRTLLGGLLRLDVSTPGEATIPSGNPFSGRPADGREELWAWGLRNPWRISFDHASGLLFIADVGQGAWEEVNVARADEAALNYGWSVMEGPECRGGGSCDRSGLTEPTLAYAHPEGCSIIGGAVYRGGRIPSALGHYFYSDLCSRFLRLFRYENGTAADARSWELTAPAQVSSMGQDAAGELYLLTVDGRVLRLDPS